MTWADWGPMNGMSLRLAVKPSATHAMRCHKSSLRTTGLVPPRAERFGTCQHTCRCVAKMGGDIYVYLTNKPALQVPPKNNFLIEDLEEDIVALALSLYLSERHRLRRQCHLSAALFLPWTTSRRMTICTRQRPIGLPRYHQQSLRYRDRDDPMVLGTGGVVEQVHLVCAQVHLNLL